MGRISIIGDGGWGTALALTLHSKGLEPVLWSHSPKYADFLDKKRENVKFLKGIEIPGDLCITSSVEEAAASDVAIFVVPCEYLRSVAEKFKNAGFSCVISATKGIERGTLKRPSEILEEYFDAGKIGVLSGPSISFEVAKQFPATVVLAYYKKIVPGIQDLLNSENFRVYTSQDVVGVELGGALKNVIAIAAGISDGMGFGANTKAAILTRGLAEISRLGVKTGAMKETFSGLSGIGDLATTCMSSQSRNRWFGQEIGRGRKVDDILKETEAVVEGIATSVSANELAKKYAVEMPITREIYKVIHEGKDARLAVKELMTRRLRSES